MTDNEINSVKTDIALIQKDIKQIESVFKKVDDAISQMSDILKAIAVQETVLENNEKRLNLLEQQILNHIRTEEMNRKELREDIESIKEDAREDRDKRHREIIETINNMNKSLTEKLDHQDKRIRALENWRWYLVGVGAVLLFVIINIPWKSFFG